MALRSARRALSGACIERTTIHNRMVQLTWTDGRISDFHFAWLRDHCPQSVHPISHQRETPLTSIRAGLAPTSLTIDEDGGGQRLRVRWPAHLDPTGTDHLSVFDASWLRANCYSSGELNATETHTISKWGAGAVLPPPIAWSRLSQTGKEGERQQLTLLEGLSEYGVGRVSGVPEDATEQLARLLGPVQETFYGYIWDTAPRSAGEVIDTAYSNIELPLHTDGAYLEHMPGLQVWPTGEH